MSDGIVALTVTYTDGVTEQYELGDGPGQAYSWRVSRDHSGVPELVIGRGLPRVHIPLGNVRHWAVREHPDAAAERERAEVEMWARCADAGASPEPPMPETSP